MTVIKTNIQNLMRYQAVSDRPQNYCLTASFSRASQRT